MRTVGRNGLRGDMETRRRTRSGILALGGSTSDCTGVLDNYDAWAFPFMRFSRGRTGLTRQIGLVPVDYLAVICPSQLL